MINMHDESIIFNHGDSINSESMLDKQSVFPDHSSSNKMISYTKSKEYSRLAAKAPFVFNPATEKKFLNEQSLMLAGIRPENSVQDKY